jgi:hypothetical protein
MVISRSVFSVLPSAFSISHSVLTTMKPLHIQLTAEQPSARFSATRMPRLEFRQALFHSPLPGWQRRLYPAALVVVTTAYDADGRVLASDHQAMRFSILYNATWPSPVFRKITHWPYKPLELRKDAPVVGYIVELKLRDLKLGEGERVEVVFLG